MVTNTTPNAYTPTARGLHWLAALLVAMLFGVGLYMTRLEFSNWKVRVYAWHEWTGLVVFVLTGVRLE
jgi:cytochrome b561